MADNVTETDPVALAEAELQDSQLAAAVATLFGDRLEKAHQFVAHLATSGIERGLLGPREIPRLWSRHVLNCAVIEGLISRDARIADVGSGAGLPGLALAIAREDLEVILIEPLERRTVWLNEVVRDLRLENVTILRARAEQVRGNVSVDYVTARAVSALVGLLDLTLPLLEGEGTLLAIKGASAPAEIEKAQKVLKRFPVKSIETVVAGEGLLADPTTVVKVSLG